MGEFVITTDSTVDLPKEYLETNGNVVLPLMYIIGEETYEDMNGLPYKEFFDRIRNGAMPTTSQINPEQAYEAFQKIIRDGKDVLHIGFSSGLSGSYNSARIAAEELRKEYKDRTILVIDTLCASMGEGLLLYYANEMKQSGKSIREIADWVESHKLRICHEVVVEDLYHLHRGGRVSKATAVIGTMAGIKPMLSVDQEGKLVAVGKVRGRKKALAALADKMEQKLGENTCDIAMICHGDCFEDADAVAVQIKERLGVKEVMINPIGSVIGSHTGPGVVAVFFLGTAR